MLHMPDDPRLINYFTTPLPVSLAALFPEPGPLHLEIGCGHGHFLAELSARRPQDNLIGVEKSLKRVIKCHEKLVKHNLTRVRILWIDAFTLLEQLPPAEELAAAYINFPDPWPKNKKRHIRKRLVSRRMFRLLAPRLLSGADCTVVSDFHRNATDADRFLSLADSGYFPVQHPSLTTELPGYPATLYEQRYRREQRTIYYVPYRRNALPVSAAPDPGSALPEEGSAG